MNAICFDLDGTLTDPKQGITGCIQYALEKLGEQSPEADELTWCIGPPLAQSLEKLVSDKQKSQEALKHYRERYAKIGFRENIPYAGIKEVLSDLSTSGYRLFVATSKLTVYADKILDHFGLAHFFEHVYGSEPDGTRSDKTELIKHILQSEDLEPSNTLMIGDRSYDAIGAKNNSIPFIGALYGYGDYTEFENTGYYKVVENPVQLPSAIMEFFKPKAGP